MKIAVIGAGLTGLVTAKCLAAYGHAPTIFEQRDKIGGVWEQSRRYAGLHIQSPRELYVFSDFDMPAAYPEFPTGKQVSDYLDAYIAKFKLKDFIRFNTRATALRREVGRPGWTITTIGPNGHASEHFDHVVVCTGRNAIPEKFEIAGQDAFEADGGRIVHSVEFHDPATAQGKDVVVVGFGKSALDVAYEARKLAKRVTVLFRRTAWHVPYKLFGLVPSKRLSYTRSAEFWFGRKSRGFQGFVHRRLPWLVQLYWAVGNFVISTHLGLRGAMRPPFPLRRSVGIAMGFAVVDNLRALRDGQITPVRGEIAKVSADGVELASGERLPAQLVILATGFDQDFSLFAPEDLAQFLAPSGDYRLYRHLIAPELPDMSFNGFNATTAVPLTSEVSAHWIARWIDGRLKRPDVKAMNAEIDDDLKWRRANLPANPSFGHFVAPLSFYYLDTLLADMGFKPADANHFPLTRNNAMLNPKDYAFLNATI